MKSVKLFLSLLLILFSTTFISAQGQCYEISDVSLYPTNPCMGDSLFLIVDHAFCAICDCDIDSIAYNTNGIIFQLESYFKGSECDFPCNSIDTLFAAIMPEGNFTFNYAMFVDEMTSEVENISVQSCDPWSAPDSLYLYPPNPCNTNNIAEIFDYIVSGCDCITDTASINVTGSQINIDHVTGHGICAAIFMCSDTFWLPILDSTFYNISYNQIDSYSGEVIFSDSTTLSICGDIGQSILSLQDIGVNIFPNPAKAKINISGLVQPYSAEILSIHGQSLGRYDLMGHTNEEIDISFLENGVYVLEVEVDGAYYYGSIIKQE